MTALTGRWREPMPSEGMQKVMQAMMQTWPGRLAQTAYQAVTLPGDVYQGNVSMYGPDGHTNPAVIGRAADLGGLLTLGAGAVPFEGNALRSGMKIYRGEYSGNKGGNFFTPDKEFARNFTQSGQDHEILRRYIDDAHIYQPAPPIFAGDVGAVDAAFAQARSQGHRAVRLTEGEGQPDSIFVFDPLALSKSPI